MGSPYSISISVWPLLPFGAAFTSFWCGHTPFWAASTPFLGNLYSIFEPPLFHFGVALKLQRTLVSLNVSPHFSSSPNLTPPLTLTMVFILRILKICTENGQINTIKTSLNKILVLGDPPPPLDGQRPYFRVF